MRVSVVKKRYVVEWLGFDKLKEGDKPIWFRVFLTIYEEMWIF